MMRLIHAACQWRQRSLDGWLIAKAGYRRYNHMVPASYTTVPLKNTSRFVCLQTTAYGSDQTPCQSLELWLMDGSPAPKQFGPAPYPARDQTEILVFSRSDLASFLTASGDTNPIHFGAGAVVPGLLILSRLQSLYGSHSMESDITIRFLNPVLEGQTVFLSKEQYRITGYIGETVCFIMTVSNSGTNSVSNTGTIPVP